jgi:hypothetical protein
MSETISKYDYTQIQLIVAEHIAELAACRAVLIETVPPYNDDIYALLVEF